MCISRAVNCGTINDVRPTVNQRKEARIPYASPCVFQINPSEQFLVREAIAILKNADQPSPYGMSMNTASVLQLQRTIGNKAVTRMMSQQHAVPTTSMGQSVIQRKLVAQYSDSLKRSATTSDLLQAFELIGMKNQILSAKANAGVNPFTFNAVLEQEIDEADFIVHLAKDKFEQSRDQISQIASNVLQKLYLDPSISNDDGENDIFMMR